MSTARISAAEETYAKLRRMILRGELQGGESLKSASLQSQFGFGATPLREALNRLSAEHLVVNFFNQGFRVAPTTSQELNDLDRVRLLLETDMLTSSIANGGDDWEECVVVSHFRLGKQAVPSVGSTHDETDQWEESHKSFHTALLSACGSGWMSILLEQIETQRTRYHRHILNRAAQVSADQSALKEQIDDRLGKALGAHAHTPLMEAALNRDQNAARRLIADHIALTTDVYQSIQSLFPENPMEASQ